MIQSSRAPNQATATLGGIDARHAPAVYARFVVYTLSIVLTLLFVALAWRDPGLLPYLSIPIALFAGLTLLGTMDLVQTRHAILRLRLRYAAA